MAEVSMTLVKEVRERSGAGMMECKKALVEADGNVEKALEILQKKGILKGQAKGARVANEGMVCSYIHPGDRIGVLLEVNIETDFAARNDEFRSFVGDVAMQIAGMRAQFVKREDISASVLTRQKEIYESQLKEEGKPQGAWPKIIEGKLNKWYQEVCLTEQESLVHEGKTVEQVRAELAGKIGENIVIRRFIRWELGEGIEKKTEDYANEVAKIAFGE